MLNLIVNMFDIIMFTAKYVDSKLRAGNKVRKLFVITYKCSGSNRFTDLNNLHHSIENIDDTKNPVNP